MKKATLSHAQTGDLTQGLAMLLHSGISVSESLFLLAREEHGPMKHLLEALGSKTEGGSHLYAAMESSGAFSQYICSMVHIGEDTGRLEEALEAISSYCQERCRVNARLKNAFFYPSMILALMLGVIGILLTQVLPIFHRVYATLGSGLTGIPALLLELGQKLSRALPWIFGIFLLLAAVLAVILLSPPLNRRCTRFFRCRFGDRGISRKFHNAHFLRGLAMGMASGLTMADALELARSLLADAPAAEIRARRCSEALSRGISLAQALEETRFLPPSASRMLTLGIRSGNADRCMARIADRLQEDAAESLDKRISRIEPAMVLTASILVGLILLSVMLPLLNILNTLG